MNAQIKAGEKHEVILEIQVPLEEMQDDIKIATKIIANQVNIPGFRKGKVPLAVLENHVGMEVILEEAAQGIIAKSYSEAIKNHDLQPVCRPQIDIKQMEKGKPFVYTATFAVKPDVTLGQYQGVEISKKVTVVGDEAVARELEKARNRVSKLVDAEEGAAIKNGDTAVIDFKGFVDEVAFPGGEAADYSLAVGSGSFIPGFEEQLVGLAVGDKKDVEVTFPEEYQEKSLAGKAAVFQVEVKGLQNKIIPDLNDDFAKEISETADTLEALKAEIRENMQKHSDKQTEQMAKGQAVAKAVEHAEMDIPQAMVEARLDDMIADMEQRLQAQGLSMDMYMQYAKIDREQLRQQYAPQALQDVKTELVLEAVAKAEDLQVSQEEIDAHIEKMAAGYWQTPDKIRAAIEENNAMEGIINGLKIMKAEEFIYDNAVVSEEVILEDVVSASAAEAEPAPAEEAEDEKEGEQAEEN